MASTSHETRIPVATVDNSKEELPLCGKICIGACFTCFFSLVASLSIAELVIATKYENDIDCSSSVGISIYQWLLTDAIVLLLFLAPIFILAFLTINIKTKRDNTLIKCDILLLILRLLSLVFTIAWTIIGSIIFWRDCSHVEPSEVNSIMWAALIIRYISIFNIYSSIHNSICDKKK
uniref:Transmembrane protein n=1 Tax=viral metagenome TaxID=1070528 RepID=A0A6C0ECC0_9ZZZZ